MPRPFLLPLIERIARQPGAGAALGLLFLLPLMFNPGWYSHDELQWAAHAQPLEGAAASAGWLEWQRFQYRPLTFQLWLWLSAALFDSPRLYHAVFALLGLCVALGVRRCLQAWGWGPARALLAMGLFLVCPYAVFVHAWVATLADLLWVGVGLAMATLLAPLRDRLGITRALMLVVLCTLALLAKESALSLAALAVVLALATRRRAHLLAALVVAVPTLIYLALRLPVILGQPGDAIYGWSPLWPPLRLLQYLLFPFALNVEEIQALPLASTGRLALAALGLLLFWAGLWRGLGALRAALWLLAAAAALGPVLALSATANQYGYGLAAVLAAAASRALPARAGMGSVLLAFALGVMLLKGLQVQAHMLDAGHASARFLPGVSEALRQRSADTVLVLSSAHSGRDWLYARLLTDLPHYAGTPIGQRVRVQDSDEGADLRILDDGSLHPIDPP